MSTAETLALLQTHFPTGISAVHATGGDPHAVVLPEQLVDVCQFLRDDSRCGFEMCNDITGVDYLEPDAKKQAKAGFEPHVEVVYHFSSFKSPGRRITLKVVLPRWKDNVAGQLPEIPSIAKVYPAANWHEREVYDLVGVRFLNHPDPRRILLADDWVGHPLRKDYEFPLEYHDIRCRSRFLELLPW
jgi:NADH-quinone oxidoreductase subunit C